MELGEPTPHLPITFSHLPTATTIAFKGKKDPILFQKLRLTALQSGHINYWYARSLLPSMSVPYDAESIVEAALYLDAVELEIWGRQPAPRV